MDEQPLSIIIQQFFGNNHKEFIQSCRISDLNEIDIDVLKKVTNYFRQVLSTHEQATEIIQAKFSLLSRKYEQNKNDVKAVEMILKDIAASVKLVTDKVTAGKEKQYSLMSRVLYAIHRIRICKDFAMPFGESKLQYVVEDAKDKVNRFNIDMKCVNEKHALIVNKLRSLSATGPVYQEWQLDIVKENLIYMNFVLRNIIGEVSAIKEKVDKEPKN